MPPHSVIEWMVGQNIPRPKDHVVKRHDLLRIELSTDDESETDILSVTYPRQRSNFGKTTPVSRDAGLKKVRFGESLGKSSLKKQSPPISGTESSTDYTTSDAVSGTANSTDTSSDTRKLRSDGGDKAQRETKKPPCQKNAIADTSGEEFDLDPHPTCDCASCRRGRRKLRQIGRWPRECKDNSEVPARQGKPIRTGCFKKSNGGKEKKELLEQDSNTDEKCDPIGVSDSSVTGDDTTEEGEGKLPKESSKKVKSKRTEKNSQSGLESKKDQNQGQENSKSSRPLPAAAPLPRLRHPHLLLPVRSEVFQVEHAVETPDDPRPNAFVDSEHGVCRVYHGPVYGNPLGQLYPSRSWNNPPLPVGVPHPLNNPYYHGFAQAADGTGERRPPVAPEYPLPPPRMPYYSTGYPFPQNHGQDVPDFQRLGPVDKAAQLGDQQAQTTTVSDPPPDLLTPRTIAAKFAEPTPSVHSLSRGKDKDRGWTSNILPIPGPPPEPTAPGSGSRHSHTSQKSKQSGASSANIPAKDIGGQGWGTDTVWDNEKTDSKMTRNVAGRNHSSSGNDGWNISPPKSDNRWGDGSEKKDGSQPGAPWEAWEANNNTSQDAVRSGQMGDANRNRNDQGNSNASNNTNGGSAHKDAWGSDDIGGYPNSQNGSNHRNISTSCSDNPLPGSMPGAWEADYNNNAVPTGWPGPNGNTNKDGRNSSGSGRGDAREGNDGNGSKSRWDDSSPPWPSWQDPSAAQSTQPDPDPGVW